MRFIMLYIATKIYDFSLIRFRNTDLELPAVFYSA